MAPRRNSQPTEAELEVLQLVWKDGSATVREVFTVLGEERGVGYTTVLKIMQIMLEKGLLKRDEAKRSHSYRPAIKREVTQKELLGKLITRAFGGSADDLIACARTFAKIAKPAKPAKTAKPAKAKSAPAAKKKAAPAAKAKAPARRKK